MPEEPTPLPCPFDRCYEWESALGVTRMFRPELHNGQGPDRSVTLFTADQMRAYALENRRAQPEPAAPADATEDELLDLEQALERRRILEEIKKVAEVHPADDMPTPFQSAWQQCCEEIFYRATDGQWHMDEDASRFAKNHAAPEPRQPMSACPHGVPHRWSCGECDTGVEMLAPADAAPSVAPEPAEPDDLPSQLDTIIDSCSEAAMTLRAMRGITDPSDFYDPFKELIRKAYWMGRDEAQAEYSTGLDNLRNALDSIKAADKELEDVRTTFAAPSVAPEPVAWTTLIEIDWVKRNAGRAGSFYAVKAGPNDIPLFAHPPRAPSVAPEPVAHMYPSDLERFKTSETFATAYSVAVGNPDERSVPLWDHPPRAPLTEGARMGIYMEFDRHADKAWTPTEYLLRFAAAVDAHGIRGRG